VHKEAYKLKKKEELHMGTHNQSQFLTRSDIINALQSIKPRQWVRYHCSHPLTQLSLSTYDAEEVRKRAREMADTGRVMLFQKKEGHRYYYFARGVDPKIKNIIETAALIASFPVKRLATVSE
jgi:hypothetical protein